MIYALSDLHLSLSPNVKNKSMDIFGDIWTNHASKIKKNWNSIITSQDLVLVCGDISWAMNLNDAKPDLNFIESLNGNKILTYGNHDYWWNSTNKLNQEYSTMKFIKNDYYIYKDFIIYVIKGSECPSHKLVDFNTKLYQREVSRLQSLLSKTKNLVNQKGLRSILIMHYPPTNGDLKNSKYIDLIKEYDINIVVFGHLHGKLNKCLNKKMKNTTYFLTSADYLGFKPILII